MKHALHERVQISWYSHLLILDTNKTSGHVSFHLNLEIYVKTPARARIKCGGWLYILRKWILNIRNAADVVLHSYKQRCLFSFILAVSLGKCKARRCVLCLLCYLTKNYAYFELLLLQYLFKNLKNNYHNTGKTGLYLFSSPSNYTHQSCYYNH